MSPVEDALSGASDLMEYDMVNEEEDDEEEEYKLQEDLDLFED